MLNTAQITGTIKYIKKLLTGADYNEISSDDYNIELEFYINSGIKMIRGYYTYCFYEEHNRNGFEEALLYRKNYAEKIDKDISREFCHNKSFLNYTSNEFYSFSEDKKRLRIKKFLKEIEKIIILDESESYINYIANFNYYNIVLINNLEKIFDIEMAYKLFEKLENKNENNKQIVFTTKFPYFLDLKDINGKNIFKQDSIYIFSAKNKCTKMSDFKVKGKRIKGDALVENFYINKVLKLKIKK